MIVFFLLYLGQYGMAQHNDTERLRLRILDTKEGVSMHS